MEYKEFLNKGKYLPSFMKDFHDQKDIFKAISETIDTSNNEIADKVDWITGHVYTIDVFLWFMGMHGYTLQKSRTKCNFKDIHETIEKQNNARREQFKKFTEERINEKNNETG